MIYYTIVKQQFGGFCMWSKTRSIILSRIVNFIFISLILLGSLFLPKIVCQYIYFTSKSQSLYFSLLITLYLAVVPCLTLLICLERLLVNIQKDNVFVNRNVTLLRIISWCCFAVSIIFAVFGFYYLLSLFIAIAAAFFGLILRVIKNIFDQSHCYKNRK